MNGTPDDDLTRHARSLRGLARALVGIEHADDLVQDATVEVLRQPPKQGISLFAWLAGVVRNRARRHHRDARHRTIREQRAAAAAPVQESTTPLDAAVHREMVARLAAVLLGLPQPYQDTLLWRYYEDLSPGEIAARSGTPLATVKSRLQRGLAMMRERLDEDRRGGDWRKALGMVFGFGGQAAAASAAAAFLGISLMLGKIALGAVAAALIGVYLWQSIESPDVALTAVAGSGAPTTVAESGSGMALADLVAQREAAPRPTTTLPASGTAAGEATIAGRCVDEAGKPLAGVRVQGKVHRSGSGWDRFAHTAASGDDGTFAISFPISADENLSLSLESPDHCEATGTFRDILAGERRDLGDLVISLAYRVRGQVVDSYGVPQPNVSVNINMVRLPRDRQLVETSIPSQPSAESDAQGNFNLRTKFPAGSYWITSNNRKSVDPEAARFELGGDQREHVLVLVVEPAPPACRGIVVSSAGSPIASAGVRLDGNHAFTDSEGRFSVQPNPSERLARRTIEVTADGYLSRRDWVWNIADTSEQRIELKPTPGLILRVIDGATGSPIDRYSVHIVSSHSWQAREREPTANHPGGKSRHLVEPGRWFVLVTPDASNHIPTAFVPFAMLSDHDVELTVPVWQEQTRRLVVTDGENRLAGIDVELLDPGDLQVRRDTETIKFPKGRLGGVQLARIVQNGTTDADGSLVLKGPKADLALRLSGEGIALQIVQPIRLDEASEIVVTAQRGARLRGRIMPPEVARHIYSASKVGPNDKPVPVGIRLLNGNVDLLSGKYDHESLHRYLEPPFPIDEDGAFDISNVPSGPWHVVVCRGSRNHATAKIDVPAGGDVECNLDLTALAPVQVTLRFLIDGTPAKDMFVNTLCFSTNDSFGRPHGSQTMGHTNDHGAIQIETIAGQLMMHVNAPIAPGSVATLITSLTVPRSGPQEHVIDLRIGSLDLTILQPDGKPAAGMQFRMADTRGSWVWTADASGRIRQEYMAAGLLTLEALPRSLSSDEARTAYAQAHGYQALEQAWVPIGSITVAPGAAAPQHLTLPSHWDR